MTLWCCPLGVTAMIVIYPECDSHDWCCPLSVTVSHNWCCHMSVTVMTGVAPLERGREREKKENLEQTSIRNKLSTLRLTPVCDVGSKADTVE